MVTNMSSIYEVNDEIVRSHGHLNIAKLNFGIKEIVTAAFLVSTI